MTKRQRFFFKELLTSPTATEAARRAGYSEKSCRVTACRNITKYNDFYLNLLVEAGIDLSTLSNCLKQGINNKDPHVQFRYVKLCLEVIDKTLSSPELEREEPILFSEIAKANLLKIKSYQKQQCPSD